MKEVDEKGGGDFVTVNILLTTIDNFGEPSSSQKHEIIQSVWFLCRARLEVLCVRVESLSVEGFVCILVKHREHAARMFWLTHF